jgi:hypothetical protein
MSACLSFINVQPRVFHERELIERYPAPRWIAGASEHMGLAVTHVKRDIAAGERRRGYLLRLDSPSDQVAQARLLAPVSAEMIVSDQRTYAHDSEWWIEGPASEDDVVATVSVKVCRSTRCETIDLTLPTMDAELSPWPP